jgi:8-oxo-dGTP pyrophosphatase MutT (NUDIX family)
MSERFLPYAAVWVLVYNEKQEIYLLRRFNTGYIDGTYTLPAGHLEEGESLQQGAHREALEEAGITITDSKLVHTAYRERRNDRIYIDVFFEVLAYQGEVYNAEPNKCDEVIWVSKDNLPENIAPSLKYALESIFRGEIYSEYVE